MSVVARQSFKYSIIGYLSSLLGIFSAIFIFPTDMEFFGKLRLIMSGAEIIVPFVIGGISYSNVKFFLKTQQDGKHHNMLSLSLLIIFINFLLFFIGFLVLPYIWPSLRELKIWQYREYVIPMVLLLSFAGVFNKFTSNYKRIAVANIFDNFLPKIANLVAFSACIYLGFSESISFSIFVLFFIISLVGYVYYTNKLEPVQMDFSRDYFKKEDLWKQFSNYSFFAFLGTFGSYVTINNNMVGQYFGPEELASYSIIYSLISIISMPQLGLFNVSAPIINKSLTEGNFKELDVFYKKTSLTLYFIGAVLFSCIVIGFPYLTMIFPKLAPLRDLQPVIWIWGSAILFDLATGFNGNILSLSKYYKFNIIMMLVLAALTLILNFYFIENTNLRLIGIAISTAISITIYNCVKVVFNYIKFDVSPFSIEMIFASIICTLAITFALILPDFNNNWINFIYKPLVVLILIGIGNQVIRIYPLDKVLNKGFLKSLFKF